MKFIQITHAGGPEVLQVQEGPKPTPAVGEVLIRVEAAGVNRPDVLQRKGLYPPPPGASPIPGLEVAGVIDQVGSQVSEWRVGDRVCALVSGGGYAEYCVAPSVQCLPVPAGMTSLQAAGLPETFFTVWANVFMRGKLRAGETVLIHGGSSGIGTTAIQLAKAFGAEVYVTAGSDEKCKACVELGASFAVNYRTQDFLEECKKATNQRGIDIILDMVAGDYFSKNIDLLAPEGRLVHIATQKGEKVELSLRTLMAKGATITGSTLRPRSTQQKGVIAAQLRSQVWPLFDSGKLRVIVDQVLPLSQASEAHRIMEKSEHIGKIILQV